MIGISSCLVGICCRYDGTSCINNKAKFLVDNNQAIAICPETLGGLSVPRIPCEIVGNKVLDKDGNDYTDNFISGATKVLGILNDHNITTVVLKSKSPSCGRGLIYDGTFSKQLVEGDGIASAYLMEHGIIVYDESYLENMED